MRGGKRRRNVRRLNDSTTLDIISWGVVREISIRFQPFLNTGEANYSIMHPYRGTKYNLNCTLPLRISQLFTALSTSDGPHGPVTLQTLPYSTCRLNSCLQGSTGFPACSNTRCQDASRTSRGHGSYPRIYRYTSVIEHSSPNPE